MPLTMIITDAGRAALVNAQNTGTAPVTIAECGLSATALAPTSADTALAGEFKRLATLSGDVVDDDMIHLVVRDESLDAYTVQSWALYLADGTLFGIYGQATPLVDKTAQSIMLLAIDVRFANVDAASLTFGDANFLNPPATTSIQGVVELATSAEATGGSDIARVPSVKAMRDAVFAWLDARFGVANAGIWHPANDGAGSGLDADMVDGKHAADFLLLSGFTGAAIRALLLGVDGAGSGLDADLLDGQDGAFYSNIAARLGFTPVNRAGDTMTGPLSLTANSRILAENAATGEGGQLVWAKSLLGSLAGDVALDVISNKFRFFENGGTNRGFFLDFTQANPGASTAIFHSGNDGAGSGLDADMLDGQQGSYYLAAASYTAADIRAKLLTVDGSGSGLDADMLDGQDGAYYANVIARLGYTPVNKAGDTMGGRLGQSAAGFHVATKDDITTRTDSGFFQTASATIAKGWPQDAANWFHLLSSTHANDANYYSMQIAASFYNSADVFFRVTNGSGAAAWNRMFHSGNDGAGSGLDADMLDGQDGAYYANIPARLGYTPVNSAAYTAADVKAKLLTVDGAGSGVDADMLDGRHASEFALNSGFQSGTAVNGYWRKLPDGTIEQWCTGAPAASGEASQFVTFPIPFTSQVFAVHVTTQLAVVSIGADVFYQHLPPALNGVTVQRQKTSGGSDGVSTTPCVYAIGI